MKRAFWLIFFILISSFNLLAEENTAVVPFTRVGGVYQSVTDSIQFKVEHFLVKNGVSLVARNKINQILEEQKLSASGIIDNEKAIELGKLASADKLVTGYVEKKGRKYFILSQLIDVKSGKIENSVYTETSTNDMFFTESIKAMVKELVSKKTVKKTENTVKEKDKKDDAKVVEKKENSESANKEVKVKIEENNEVMIAKQSFKVNKISFDYFDKDRFTGQFYVVSNSGDSSFVKGELYVEDEVFDIYKRETDQYPSITEDIVYISPCDNSIISLTGTKSRIKQKLSDVYIKNGNEKYLVGDARVIAYANRIDDKDAFFKEYTIKKEWKDETSQTLANYLYSNRNRDLKVKSEKWNGAEKFKIKAQNFEGEINLKDIEYIFPANYKIKLRNGYIIRYFDPESSGVEFNYDDKENFDIICAKESADKYKEEFLKSFGSKLPEDPFFVENIKEIKIKEFFKDYDKERWKIPQMKAVYLDSRGISDISDLKGLIEVRTLSLKYNNIEDITPIASLINIRDLYLSGNKIKEFDTFTNFKRIISLDVSNNGLLDLEGIEKIWWLKDLNAGQNRIFEINVLENMKELKYLDLSKTRVEDMSPVSNLINLERIILNGNQLFYNIYPLAKLENLKSLHMMETSIQDISILSKLKNLERVNIANTQVNDIEPLKELKFLNWISISGTKTDSSSFRNWNFNGDIEIWDSKNYINKIIKKEERAKYGIKDGTVVYSYE